MIVEQKIEKLGMKLPESSAPQAMYVPVKQMGNALFISGQGPFVDGKPAYIGKVGRERTIEEAQEAATICILNMLAAVKHYLSDLDRVASVVKLQAFVNSADGFSEQHVVTNAASQLLYDIFGESGRHARTAIGVNELPMDITVEIEAIFEIKNV